MFWLSRITEHSSYAGGLLGPMLITALGLGLLPMSRLQTGSAPLASAGDGRSAIATSVMRTRGPSEAGAPGHYPGSSRGETRRSVRPWLRRRDESGEPAEVKRVPYSM
jgi:hypothetical protein